MECLNAIASAVVVITVRGRRGDPIGLTVQSFCSQSVDPPLALWSLARNTARFDDFNNATRLAVHVLAADQQDLARHFSNTASDRFSDVLLRSDDASALPIIAGAIAVLECVPVRNFDSGDHVIHVVQVEHATRGTGSPLVNHVDESAPQTLTKLDTDNAERTGFVDRYLPYLIGRAGFEVNRSFSRLLYEHDIQPAEWRVLATLADCRMSVGELAAIVLLKQPTLTKLLDRMEIDALVVRESHPDDRRKVLLNVTTEGRALADQLTALALKHERQIVTEVPALARPEVEQALRALIKNFDSTD